MSNALHFAIAEQGKLSALSGDHVSAMNKYREAMNLAVKQGAPEVMFRHYMECSLESLEHMGELVDVLGYCDRALEHYADSPPAHDLARQDLASIHQRRGVILFKQGEHAEARTAMRAALDVLESFEDDDHDLPLARAMLRWIDGRMHLSPTRLESELSRHHYYSVRRDTVSKSRAQRFDKLTGAASFLSTLERT